MCHSTPIIRTSANESGSGLFHSSSIINAGSTSSSFINHSDDIEVNVASGNDRRPLNFAERLTKWKVQHKSVSKAAANDLLSILKDEPYAPFSELPKTFQTLFAGTYLEPEATYSVEPGEMVYFSIERMLNHGPILKKLLRQIPETCKTIRVCLHCDGMQPFKSSEVGFWPILGIVFNIIFVVALWCGPSKPSDSRLYLDRVVDEVIKLNKGGIYIGDAKYAFSLVNIRADAPAKSFLLKVKYPKGHWSCLKCWAQYFNEADAALRTSEEFRQRADPNFHHDHLGTCKFVDDPNFDFVKMFVNDYMHSVCLGVTKRILTHWISGPRKKRGQVFRPADFDAVNEHLRMIRKKNYCPSEFARKPRRLPSKKKKLKFKATEYRQLLLYTGPVIFRNRLSVEHKKLFLLLSTSIRYLTNLDSYIEEDKQYILEYVQKLLRLFVHRCEGLYGQAFVTYNFHSLLHLCADCAEYGSVDNFSCFAAESELGILKRSIKG